MAFRHGPGEQTADNSETNADHRAAQGNDRKRADARQVVTDVQIAGADQREFAKHLVEDLY